MGDRTLAVTLVMPYYRNPEMLEYHLEVWRQYSDDVKRRLTVIIVDDGSPEPAKLEAGCGFPVSLYRIKENKPWNMDGARNLALSQVTTPWCLMTDIDHVLMPHQAEKMLNATCSPGSVYVPARRQYSGRPTRPHPNSYLIEPCVFWSTGGYDEDWCGWYGSDVCFRRNLEAVAPIFDTNAWYLTHCNNLINDATTKDWSRSNSSFGAERNPHLVSKLRGTPYKAVNPIRFNWSLSERREK